MCLFILIFVKITVPGSLVKNQNKFGAIFDVNKLTLI